MRRVSTPSSSPVSRDEALSIALVEADLTQADISRERVEYDRDDGMEIYEVEFRSGDYEYSYDIDASNGRVMAGEYEIRGRVASNRNAELISTSEAEMIVRSLIDSNADYVRIRSDYDDGIYIYEADMYAQGIDYEVELNAATGDVIKFIMGGLVRPLRCETSCINERRCGAGDVRHLPFIIHQMVNSYSLYNELSLLLKQSIFSFPVAVSSVPI